jgi:DNA-binding CsgD family transcriptional regulator
LPSFLFLLKEKDSQNKCKVVKSEVNKMGLNDRQLKVIELYASGTTVTDIAKITGVSRQTIYTDLDNKEVKAGIDRCITELKSQAEKKIIQDVDLYIAELKKLALTSKSEKIRSENLQYLLNRTCGTPTNKVADVTKEEDKEDKFDLDGEILNNVIELNKAQ